MESIEDNEDWPYADPDAIPVPPVDFADRMASYIDAVREADAHVSAAHYERTVALDAAARFSEACTLPGQPITGAQWDGHEASRRSLRAEISCALRVPEVTVGTLLEESARLVQSHPATLEALRLGRISYRHAHVIVDEARSLPEEIRFRFEGAVLDRAAASTVAQFTGQARKIRERMHPASIETRKQRSLEDRRFWFEPRHDGMAHLETIQSADDARAAFDRVTEIARSLQGVGEERTLAQLRVDVVTDLLLSGVTSAGLGAGVQASVHVTVPVLSLLGRDAGPAQLEGYGPIDLETAKRLAGTATSFLRVLTHPETGCVLSVGKNPLRVPGDLKRWLQVRDESCRFPGCGRPARQCEIDHTVDRQFNGPMTHDNLAHLCKAHHLLKHQTPWSLTQGVDGVLAWTSPAGRRYVTEPANRIRPTPKPIDPDAPPPF